MAMYKFNINSTKNSLFYKFLALKSNAYTYIKIYKFIKKYLNIQFNSKICKVLDLFAFFFGCLCHGRLYCCHCHCSPHHIYYHHHHHKTRCLHTPLFNAMLNTKINIQTVNTESYSQVRVWS